MDLLDIPEKTVEALRESRNSIENSILNGLLKDWDAYKEMVGRRQALLGIEDFIVSAVKSSNK